MESANHENNHDEKVRLLLIRKLFVSGSRSHRHSFPSFPTALPRSQSPHLVASCHRHALYTTPIVIQCLPSPCSVFPTRLVSFVSCYLSSVLLSLSLSLPYFFSFLQSVDRSIRTLHPPDPVGGIDRLHHRGWALGRYRKPKAPSLRA